VTVRGAAILIGTIVGTVAAAAIVVVVVDVRVTTGVWRLPHKSDFVRAEHDLVRIARRLGHKPSKTIYLERGPVDIAPGEDDSAAGLSGVLANNANRPIKTRGWSGGKVQWAKIVGCVQHELGAFDVAVTDKRPVTDDFVLVAVGGYPTDVGLKDKTIAGIAPFSGEVIPRPIVFAFSAQIENDVGETCEVIAHEVAHTYGADHEFLCEDVMTYLSGCGHKVFVDKDAPCGEKATRECEGGQATQNSYRRLLTVLGTRLPKAK
jgi:hypothetical protein